MPEFHRRKSAGPQPAGQKKLGSSGTEQIPPPDNQVDPVIKIIGQTGKLIRGQIVPPPEDKITKFPIQANHFPAKANRGAWRHMHTDRMLPALRMLSVTTGSGIQPRGIVRSDLFS